MLEHANLCHFAFEPNWFIFCVLTYSYTAQSFAAIAQLIQTWWLLVYVDCLWSAWITSVFTVGLPRHNHFPPLQCQEPPTSTQHLRHESRPLTRQKHRTNVDQTKLKANYEYRCRGTMSTFEKELQLRRRVSSLASSWSLPHSRGPKNRRLWEDLWFLCRWYKD